MDVAGSQILPNVVCWLMLARTAGHWPSTYESAWSDEPAFPAVEGELAGEGQHWEDFYAYC